MTATTFHSSTAGRPASPRVQTPSAPSSPDLFALEDSGTSAPAAPPALELLAVLQHALKDFEARVALVEANAKEETTLLARLFATRKTALKQELACLRRSEKDLSKRLHDRYQEVVELEEKILPLRIRVFELEETAEASKAKMAGFEERSINREVQPGRVEAELLQQAKRFEEAEAEMTGDDVDVYDAGFEDAFAQVACVHPEMDASPFAVSNRIVNGQIVPRILPL